MEQQSDMSLVSFLLAEGAESLKSQTLLIKFFMTSMASDLSNSGKMTFFNLVISFYRSDLQGSFDIVRLKCCVPTKAKTKHYQQTFTNELRCPCS